VHHLTATDGIIAGLFAAYTAYRLWSGWGDGVIYGDGDDDVRADEQSTACRGDGSKHHFHRHHFGLFRVRTWRAEASPFPRFALPTTSAFHFSSLSFSQSVFADIIASSPLCNIE
jgi:hypothetical protein